MNIEENISIEEANEVVAKIFFPGILYELYQRGFIKDSDGRRTILRIFREKSNDNTVKNIIEDMSVKLTISENFKEAILEEIQKRRIKIAICLSGIYIEQIANDFYHQILYGEYEFSNRNFDECMKSVTLKGKLTWLFKLTTSTNIDSELISEILEIISERNKIVHYKPVVVNIDEMADDKEFDPNILITVIERLEKVFDEAIKEMFPDITMGRILYDRLCGNEDET